MNPSLFKSMITIMMTLIMAKMIMAITWQKLYGWIKVILWPEYHICVGHNHYCGHEDIDHMNKFYNPGNDLYTSEIMDEKCMIII